MRDTTAASGVATTDAAAAISAVDVPTMAAAAAMAAPNAIACFGWASMATGRLLAQRVERPSVAARMLFAGLSAAAGLVLATAAEHAAVALLGFVVAGGGLALCAPTIFGEAGRLGGEGGRGASVSTVAILGYLGFLAGPPLIGGVAGATSLRGGFVFLCVMALLLAACALLLRRAGDESPG